MRSRRSSGRMAKRPSWVLGVLAGAAAVVGTASASPLIIPSGHDLFVSPSGRSSVNLGGPIGNVLLRGQPTGPLGHTPDPFLPLVEFDELGMLAAHGVIDHRLGGGLSMVDTVVRRDASATLPMVGSMDTIPIELVSLSLVSVNPIELFPGSFFDVFVTLDPLAPPSLGSMTLTRLSERGGTFDSFFDVFVEIDLTPVGGGPPFQVIRAMDHLESSGVPWRVPEPASGSLLGLGLLGLAVRRRAA